MNSDRDHPLMGMCIVIFLFSMALLTLCAPLFEQYPWISSRLFISLILTVLGDSCCPCGPVWPDWRSRSASSRNSWTGWRGIKPQFP